MNFLVSVIIPVYNVEKHLNKCLDSIVNQTYKNLEIIIINDGSKDASAEICREYAEKDNRIVFVSRENRGVSATRNEGIELAHGDYFSFIDADDYLELDAYEYLISIINEKNVEAINFEHYITYPTHEIEHISPDRAYGYADKYEAQRKLLYYYPFACNKLFTKKMIKDIKFNHQIARGEDSLFARMAFQNTDSVWFDRRPLYHYVQSDESAVRGSFRTAQLTATKLFDIYTVWYSKDFPLLLPYCMFCLETLMIMLYYDMWADSIDYREKQKEIFELFKKNYKTVKLCDLSLKEKLKLLLFRISPTMFCILHKFKIG
ncbi:MAG: glycosyltransferase family 2 protein [Clostridia bacterium]|nr:glycosyltransferase family 2 protein [Clostridia bacterium]MBR3592477.1 glycosyltransferase family 2 protein [Clostridia bacterium]